MTHQTKDSAKHCLVCNAPLAEGVRFCAACGMHHFDRNAAKIAAAQRDMDRAAKQQRMAAWKYWWRFFMTGLRR